MEKTVTKTRGRGKPKKEEVKEKISETLHCLCCGKEFPITEFYHSEHMAYESTKKLPYCRRCIDKFYQHYLTVYKRIKYINPERKAIERMCMLLNIYYSDAIYDSAVNRTSINPDATLFALYLAQVKLNQYRKKNYDTTITERFEQEKKEDISMPLYAKSDQERRDEIQEAIRLFGEGFTNEDYLYLYDQYADWTMRHECETKSQEEIFKRICFKQLEILKATRQGADTKDLDASLLKILDAAKLQPKQNAGETVSDAQTFGTLIDKWENTRPLPEIDEELKDVDKIGKYINIFFKGHLSKMMGIKNSFCKAYDDFMKRYSVKRPEYESEDYDSEALFDAIFGGDLDDK